MKRMLLAGFAGSLALAMPAFAASPFDGTWKGDVASAKLPEKPDVFLLRNGVYTCKTCVPPYSVKADGAFHPVKGQPYFDAASVKVVDAHTTIETHRKKGKVMNTVTATVTPDGKTVHFVFKDMSPPNGKVVEVKGSQTLVAPGPKGSHATSGTWKNDKVESVSDAGITMMLKDDGKSFTMTTPAAISYTAAYGGPAVPIKGDHGGTYAKVAKPDAHTIVETDVRGGKTVGIYTMKIVSDGVMAITSEDTQRGTKTEFTAKRQ